MTLGSHLNVKSPVGRTVWEESGGVASLEDVVLGLGYELSEERILPFPMCPPSASCLQIPACELSAATPGAYLWALVPPSNSTVSSQQQKSYQAPVISALQRLRSEDCQELTLSNIVPMMV